MDTPKIENTSPVARAKVGRPPKKQQILALYASGFDNVQEISALTQTRMSYVASVLKSAGHLPSYYDLYTSASSMNAYSRHFRGRVGFKDESVAAASVTLMQHLYDQFGMVGDRAGQHHVLVEALTLFNRARWSGKTAEARFFAKFLSARLAEVTDSSAASQERLH